MPIGFRAEVFVFTARYVSYTVYHIKYPTFTVVKNPDTERKNKTMDHLAEEGPAEPFSESELVEVLMSRDESGNEQPPFRIVTDELVGR